MIKNFLLIAIRNFFRQKLYSIINVVGLSSGLICALFIYLWVNDEIKKDTFHKDSEKIFQIVSNLNLGDGEILTWAITPGPLAEDIRDNSPEIEMAVRTMTTGSQLFRYEDKSFLENGIYADPDFFRLFSFPFLKGKPNTDSTDITTISISNQLAQKLFGQEDPIGKTVKGPGQTDFTVGGLFADIGGESSIKFDYVLPFEIFKKNRGQGFNWGNFDHPLYVRLSDPAQAEKAINSINERRKKAAGPDGNSTIFYIQPFTDYYLHSQYENGKPVGGRIKYVKIFSIVAVFILAIACINFMNMSTARAVSRAKEVGVRKAIGAQRRSLISQFMAESILISLISMIIALTAVYLALPMFNSLVAKQIVLNFGNAEFLLTIIAITLVTGLLAGSYPAFVLSSYKPALVLKGASVDQAGRFGLRKVLVVFQFTLTVILIACSLVIYNQIQFIRNTDLGYNRQSVLSFSARGNLFKEFEVFKNELLASPGVVNVSKANGNLVQVNNQNSSVKWPGKPDNSNVFFRTLVVDYDFLETMGLKLESGRTFSKDFNDTSNFVVTKKSVEVMGLKDPIGVELDQWGVKGKIVGVVNDFHSRSMHEAIDPIVFLCKPEWTGLIFVRFDGSKTQDVIATVEKAYKKYLPEYPFSYSFVDQDFEKLYNNEKVTGSLALGFTVMAIIISGLGLIGLAAYTAEKKRKEISIRKTLGASVSGIITMMSGEFVKLSLIATAFGCPVAYLAMSKFLEGYAYHTELTWLVFVYTAMAVLATAMVTVLYQVAKAASANPVDALRNE